MIALEVRRFQEPIIALARRAKSEVYVDRMRTSGFLGRHRPSGGTRGVPSFQVTAPLILSGLPTIRTERADKLPTSGLRADSAERGQFPSGMIRYSPETALLRRIIVFPMYTPKGPEGPS